MESTGYPVKATAQIDEKLSRLLIFLKWILAIPHFFVVTVIMMVTYLFIILAWFAILFTGKYPTGLFNFVVGTLRWSWRLNMYLLLITDKYPPFTLDNDADYPAQFEVSYPERLSRLLIFFKMILIIPHIIVLYVLQLVMCLFLFIGWFAILFTGEFPNGMANFVIGVSRWLHRIYAYMFLLTDAYPPFSLEE